MAEMDTLMELAKGVETAPVERSLAPTGLVDMPQEVLSGRLGEIYQKHLSAFPIAYVWPALVTSAGLLVPLPTMESTAPTSWKCTSSAGNFPEVPVYV